MDEREQLIKDLKEIAEEIKENLLQESSTGEQQTQVKEKKATKNPISEYKPHL